jgi:hypothetical protein
VNVSAPFRSRVRTKRVPCSAHHTLSQVVLPNDAASLSGKSPVLRPPGTLRTVSPDELSIRCTLKRPALLLLVGVRQARRELLLRLSQRTGCQCNYEYLRIRNERPEKA